MLEEGNGARFTILWLGNDVGYFMPVESTCSIYLSSYIIFENGLFLIFKTNICLTTNVYLTSDINKYCFHLFFFRLRTRSGHAWLSSPSPRGNFQKMKVARGETESPVRILKRPQVPCKELG